MKKNKKILFISIILFFVIIYYYPFTTDKQCGELSLCWVKFGVYEYDYDSEVGNRYFGTDMQFYDKIGGFWEYIGLKKINCKKSN